MKPIHTLILITILLAGIIWGATIIFSQSSWLNSAKEVDILSKASQNDISQQELSSKGFLDILEAENQKIKARDFFTLVLPEKEAILINLSAMKLYLIREGNIVKQFAIKSRGPQDKWFRTPAGYFRVGAKYKLLKSSKVDVYMPYSVQFYQDFFIHGIPYYPNGERVSSSFSGGCLRLEDADAKEVYDFSRSGMLVIIIEDIESQSINSQFTWPVNPDKSWIRQGFISPLLINGQYLQHTGVDFGTLVPESVFSIFDGRVVYLQVIGPNDHGLGNTVILEHELQGQKFYSLYGHLESIAPNLVINNLVKKGDVLGTTGASGYGCNNYWRIGEDGCFSQNVLDRHLHFEVKTNPVLYNPRGDNICPNYWNGLCYGYTPKYPQDFGYFDPMSLLLFNQLNGNND